MNPRVSAEQTLLDRAIQWVAPRWALKRMAARVQIQHAKAYYDGATTGRRGASIRRSGADANVVTARTLPKLRAGSRDLIRNNPHAKRATEAIVSNTVGIGIGPQFMREGEKATDLDRLAKAHLETTECDTEGRNTYAGLQALAMETIVGSGEVLIRRRFRRASDGLTVPLQFQVLEPDYLDDSKDGPTSTGGQIVQGVEYDRIGRIRGYWLYKNHPGSARLALQSDFVPARDIAHVFRTERPGQARGIPWAAPIMLRVQDFADYEEAVLVRQKIAACFAGFIQETFDRTLGAPPGSETDDDGNVIDTLEPGLIERLPPGTEIKFADPPQVEGYGEYTNVSLHAIAMGFGVSYEALTGDLRGVSFSSGKMGRLEFERNLDRWQQLMLVPQLCAPLTRWWLEAAELIGEDVDGVTVKHIAPRKEMIDPPRERRAEREAIRSGQKTLTQVIREGGRDPVEHLTELAEDFKLLDELEIVLDSDPRKRTAAGLAIEEGENGGSNGGPPSQAEDRLQGLLEDLEDLFAGNGAHR